MTTHVPENDLKQLALGTLLATDAVRVQQHIFKCAPCLRRLIRIEVLLARLEMLVDILPRTRRNRPVFIVHDTADGLIYSKTEKEGRKWIARHWGDQLQGRRECKTVGEANEFLVRSFREMFPEHRCTTRCRVNPD
jgi:hypothetical protein